MHAQYDYVTVVTKELITSLESNTNALRAQIRRTRELFRELDDTIAAARGAGSQSIVAHESVRSRFSRERHYFGIVLSYAESIGLSPGPTLAASRCSETISISITNAPTATLRRTACRIPRRAATSTQGGCSRASLRARYPESGVPH